MAIFDNVERVLPYLQTILAMHADQNFDNFEWLRERDKLQAVQLLGLAAASPILVTGVGPFNLTNLLTVPVNDFEAAQWALIGWAEVQRAAGFGARISLNIAVTGGSGGTATDGTFEFLTNQTARGSFAQCVMTRTASISEALQFRMTGGIVSGAGTMNVYRAALLAVRIV